MAQTNVQAFSGDVEMSGSVGVGTASPRQKLEVADGNISIVNNSWKSDAADDQLAGKIDFHLGGDSSQLATPVAAIEAYDKYQLGNPFQGDLAFKTMGSERMRISSGGNVGIGTNASGAPLEIFTTTEGNSSTLILKRDVTTYGGSDDGAAIEFQTRFTGNSATYGQVRIRGVDDNLGDSGEGGIAFDTLADQVYYERMRIKHNGNVGIGTNDPAAKLTIGSTASLLFADNRAASDARNWAIRVNNTNEGDFQIGHTGSNSGGLPNFYTDPGDAKVTLNKDGNVGVGRTNPLAPLDVKAKKGIVTATSFNDLYSNATIMITGTAENADALCIGMLGTDTGGDSGNNPYAYMQNIWDQTIAPLAQPILLNPIGGGVGIGSTNTNGHALNVNGRAFANHLQAPNYFYVYTNIGADGNWRTAFNIGSTAIGFFTVLSNNAGYGQSSAIWWYQYKAGGTSGYVSRISGSSTPNFRLTGQAVQSQGSGQQFVQVRTLPVSN
jgi:hypothetical protein